MNKKRKSSDIMLFSFAKRRPATKMFFEVLEQVETTTWFGELLINSLKIGVTIASFDAE